MEATDSINPNLVCSSNPNVAIEPPTPRKDTFSTTQSSYFETDDSNTGLGLDFSSASSPLSVTSPSGTSNHQSPPATTMLSSSSNASHRHHPYSHPGGGAAARSRTNSHSSHQRRARSATMTSSNSVGAASEWSTDFGEREMSSDSPMGDLDRERQQQRAEVEEFDDELDELEDDEREDERDQDWMPRNRKKTSQRASQSADRDSSKARSRQASTSSSSHADNNKNNKDDHTFVPPKRSHRRKQAEGHIKRPPNAFILFRAFCSAPSRSMDDHNGIDPPGKPTADQLASLNIVDHRHISRICSHLWKNLSVADRAYWEDLAKRRKLEHAKMYPDYRYKPVFRHKEETTTRKSRAKRKDREFARDVCAKVASELLGGTAVFDQSDAAAASSSSSSSHSKAKRSRAKKPPAPLPSTTVPNGVNDQIVVARASVSSSSSLPPAPAVFPVAATSLSPPSAPTPLSRPIPPAEPVQQLVELLDPANAIHVQHRQPWTFETLRKAMQGEADLPPPYPSLPYKPPSPKKSDKAVRSRKKQTQAVVIPMSEQAAAAPVDRAGKSKRRLMTRRKVKLIVQLQSEPDLVVTEQPVTYARSTSTHPKYDAKQFQYMTELDQHDDSRGALQTQIRQVVEAAAIAAGARNVPRAGHSLDISSSSSFSSNDGIVMVPQAMSRTTSTRKAPPSPLDLGAPSVSSIYRLPLPKSLNQQQHEGPSSPPPPPPSTVKQVDDTVTQLATFKFGTATRHDVRDSTADATPTTTSLYTADSISRGARLSITSSPTSDRWRRQSLMLGMRRRGTIEFVSPPTLSTPSAREAPSTTTTTATPVLSDDQMTYRAQDSAGTVTASLPNVSADLMLISPIAPTFEGQADGRRFSLGRWVTEEVDSSKPRQSQSSLSSESTATTLASGLVTSSADYVPSSSATAFSVEPDYLSLLTAQPFGHFDCSQSLTEHDGEDVDGEEFCGMRDLGMAVDEASDESGRPWTATSSSNWSTTDNSSTCSTTSRPATATSDADDLEERSQQDFEAASKFWSRSQQQQQHSFVEFGVQPLEPGSTFHVDSREYFQAPSSPISIPTHPPIDSAAFGFVVEGPDSSDVDSSPFNPWSWRRQTLRGSDATLRGRQDSIARLSSKHLSQQHVVVDASFSSSSSSNRFSFNVPSSTFEHSSMMVVDNDEYFRTLQFELDEPERQIQVQDQRQQQQPRPIATGQPDLGPTPLAQAPVQEHGLPEVQTEAMNNVVYIYLTREQAKDAQLVDSFLRLGYGVTFDR
ncbi:hypothetical protein ACM66B_000523 [Microbotryomycetes sp. NB124-2]